MTTLNLTISKTDIKRIDKKLKTLDPLKAGSVVATAFQKSVLFVESKLKTNVGALKFFKTHPTGKLAQSISSKVVTRGNSVIGVVGSGARSGKRVPYANIQETGGVIRPKKSKYLTIPLSNNRTASGAMRKTARQVIDEGNTFVRPSKSGTGLILFQRIAGAAVPMFVLEKEVKVPGTRYLSKTLKETQAATVKTLLVGIEKGLKNG